MDQTDASPLSARAVTGAPKLLLKLEDSDHALRLVGGLAGPVAALLPAPDPGAGRGSARR